MIGPRSTFALAASISLAVHAALFLTMPRVSVGVPQGGSGKQKEIPKPMTVVLVPEVVKEDDAKEFEMGDAKGKGFALHEVDAPNEATAPEADTDQALLSLDPSGVGEKGTDQSVAKVEGDSAKPGEAGGAPPTLVANVVAPPTALSLTPFGLTPEPALPRVQPRKTQGPITVVQPGDDPREGGSADLARPVTGIPLQNEPTPPAPIETKAVVVAPRADPSPVLLPTPKAGGAQAGASKQAAADPARMSDSESDPFSRLGTATFLDGAVQVQFGRKVKTRRPKLLLAGQIDLVSLRKARVQLKIDTDETGKVTSVEVLKSSGSNAIDQPTRVAVYDWWFEPPKDASGQPIADEFQFTIGWR